MILKEELIRLIGWKSTISTTVVFLDIRVMLAKFKRSLKL